jgi:uncharacterized protein (TIGR04222 family)
MKYRKWIGVAMVAAALLSTAGVAFASGNLYWDRYDVDITVNPDGTLRVAETQTIVFVNGSFHVGFASIPTERTDSVYDIQVTEGDRVYRRVSGEIEGGFQTFPDTGSLNVEWYFPYTSRSQRTFTLAYTVAGGLRYYPKATPPNDILQWFAIGSQHDFPINHSRVTVRLPHGVNVLRDTSLPSGYAADVNGVDATTQVDVERGIVTCEATRAIGPGESMEIGVSFEHGGVAGQAPAWQAQEDRVQQSGPLVAFLSLFSTIGILVLGPLGLFLLWYTKGRDPQVGLAAEYLSEPPSNAPPGVMGVLIDEHADMKDVIATLIDLARRGALTMEETQTEGLFGIGASRDFIFRANPGFDANSLRPYERTLLSRVVGAGEHRLSALKNQFYTAIPTIENQLYDAAVQEGYFPASPQGVRNRYYLLGGALMVIAAIAAFTLIPAFVQYSVGVVFPVAALGLVGLIAIVVASVMPARTRKGAEEVARWRAFETFMKDLPRFQKVGEATALFDKYLPYAIAFGLERRWINTFAQTNAPAPIWYYPWIGPGRIYGAGQAMSGGAPSTPGMSGGLAGSLQSINNGLTSLFNQAGQVFRSTPGGASGGGFSGGYRGGGFRGGGFRVGGGGGGGARGFR